MNSFSILLNKNFSNSTGDTIYNPYMSLYNNYLVYNVSSNGNGLTNEFNVRNYLTNPNNSGTTSVFSNFLATKLPILFIKEVLSNDKTLSYIFNNFWSTNYIGSSNSIAYFYNVLTGFTQIQYNRNYFNYDSSYVYNSLIGSPSQLFNSTRDENTYYKLDKNLPSDDSYFIPVNLYSSYKNLNTEKDYIKNNYITAIDTDSEFFYAVNSNPNSYIHTIMQDFVDLNLNQNENGNLNSLESKKVNFEFSSYQVNEGSNIEIKVKLNSISTTGLENCSVYMLPITASISDINEFQPILLNWSIGDQEKIITINTKPDFLEETTESFKLFLSGFFNCIPGEINECIINISDQTQLNKVGLIANDFSSLDNNNKIVFNTFEGNSITVSVALDNLSDFGVEKVKLNLYSQVFPNVLGNLISSNLISFNQYELVKQVTFSFSSDLIVENTQILKLVLELPENCILDKNSKSAYVFVADDSLFIKRKYTQISFDKFFRQKGKISQYVTQQKTQFKYFESTQTVNSDTNSWLVRRGDSYIDNTNISPDGFPQGNYSEFPNYSFGKIFLIVKNTGNYNVFFNENIYEPNDEFEIEIDQDNYLLELPSNSQLVQVGETLPDGSVTQESIYLKSFYEFKFRLELESYEYNNNIYFPHNFQLKNPNQNTENTISIGNFELENFDDVFAANENKFALYSRYTNATSSFNGSSCSLDFSSYSSNVKLKGFVFLEENSQTNYDSFTIEPENALSIICQENSGVSNNITWKSIEIEAT